MNAMKKKSNFAAIFSICAIMYSAYVGPGFASGTGFIWASENIATNTPTVYEDCLPIFAELLNDENKRVRIEAPEMFRVLGKRKPEFVRPYLEKLEYIATHDEFSIVRIHAKGAIKATLSKID